MLTVIIKRNAEPTVIQMTQENIIKDLRMVNGSEMLLEDTWVEGLRKVRTPYVCLLEADCILSANYIASNVGLMKKTTKSPKGGGYNKLAMIASCVGVSDYANRIYSYKLEMGPWRTGGAAQVKSWEIKPSRDKRNMSLYHVQVGFVPGAIIRMSAIDKDIENILWDKKNLVEMSTAISFHFWNTGRRIQVNPNTTYVSSVDYLEEPPRFKFEVSTQAENIFHREDI